MTRDELERRAAELGVKPATLRMKLYREKLRARAKSYVPPLFETFGLKLDPKFSDELKAVRLRLETAARRIGQARIELERVLRSKLPAPVAQLEQLEGLCLSLEQRIAEAMPRSLCPYCKGQDRAQPDCKPCGGSGLASALQYDKAPRRLKEAAVVLLEGKEVALDELAQEAKREPFG